MGAAQERKRHVFFGGDKLGGRDINPNVKFVNKSKMSGLTTVVVNDPTPATSIDCMLLNVPKFPHRALIIYFSIKRGKNHHKKIN